MPAGTDAIVKDSLIMWPERQWEALKKNYMKRGQTDRQTEGQTSRLNLSTDVDSSIDIFFFWAFNIFL